MDTPKDIRLNQPDINAIREYLLGLQSRLCVQLQQQESSAVFTTDEWQREAGGGGLTRVIERGDVFEKGGVNFSEVTGDSLPASASAHRPELVGRSFRAMGISLVLHPCNPYVPVSHMNVRFFLAEKEGTEPVWWFGGGFDLTPCYGFAEDVRHWHRTARAAVSGFGAAYYSRFKKNCDEYFYLKHRHEARGVGGLFFDDFNELGFDQSFALVRSVGDHFIPAYCPLVEQRKTMAYGPSQRAFQCFRRGRYVEFNLVYDRGTLFGLQSGGRTESILMSLPPVVHWGYQHSYEAAQCQDDSPEQRLYREFLPYRDWLA